MTLRSSPFINFTTGDVLTPPMVLQAGLPPRSQQTQEQMLALFQCRVDVWKFGPATSVLALMEKNPPQSSVWAHAAYALLDVTCSYFEMIGKILNPKSRYSGSAGVDFNFGFCDVYPKFATAGVSRTDKDLPDVKGLRDRLRNGLYHLGYTKAELMIHHQPSKWPEDCTVVQSKGANFYLVNPHNMTRTIVEHFPGLLVRLRDQSKEYDLLRRKFKDFYTEFHDVPTTVPPP